MDMTQKFADGVRTALEQNTLSSIRTATSDELYNACGRAVNGLCHELISDTKGEKRACYFSAEFLLGRLIYSNLSNLGILDEAGKYLSAHGRDIREFENIEDAALGNGGLGRLAACFLDSAASTGVPLDGYGIRYRYGIFRQKIADGAQKELADNWLTHGDPFGIRCDSEAVTVEFADMKLLAVPYDYYVIGAGGACVNRLRLYQAEAVEPFDFDSFDRHRVDDAFRDMTQAMAVSAVLYPNDNDEKGKLLRIRQQYFFCSAAIKNILSDTGADAGTLSSVRAVQLNDTHPTVAIPELIRLLMKRGNDFESAFSCASKVFAYTNHTVMAEALETWDLSLYSKILPEITAVIEMIDKRLCGELKSRGVSQEDLGDYRIVCDGKIHMARLAVYCSYSVNGVARIHTQILKNDVLREWYELYPQRFSNKTNGITQRRWLALSNPKLCGLIANLIGSDFVAHPDKLEQLASFSDDSSVLEKLNEIKHENKVRLSEYLRRHQGVDISPDFVFSVQVKRIHEYKRQLMNALSVADIYFSLKSGELKRFYPTVFLIGGKAAPGYRLAKGIIKYINELAAMINSDCETSDRLKVVFAENYNVSAAEVIIPAADISEQISLAGTEASGTGNMKFMMNGAVTLGTFDGANIEIVEQAGEENNYIFGLREDEVGLLEDSYDPKQKYATEPRIKRAVDTLIDGTLSDGGSGVFRDIYNSLLKSSEWQTADRYLVLEELLPYTETRIRAINDYNDRRSFARKALMNISGSGIFSSDRTIDEYARQIWFAGSGKA